MTNAVNIAQSGSNNVTMRNRVINGAMVIDQRNAGASITLGSGSTAGNYQGYVTDRAYVQSFSSTTGNGAAFTAQQNAGSVTPPPGFTNYAGLTVTSTQATLQNNSLYRIAQRVEGFNIADLGWGTASAQPITVSFWVRSSVTGTFGGAITNVAAGGTWRSYPFTYTISASNTWEYKTITIPGDTVSVWNVTNGVGIELSFAIGVSASWGGTPNTWQNSEVYGASGCVNLMATNGATFYITGVQLEEGTAASPFENRLYGTELALCQRYYSTGVWATGAAYPSAAGAISRSSTSFKVTMRATPTVTSTSAGYFNASSITFNSITVDGSAFDISQSGSAGNYTGAGTYKAEIEL